jgi:hypothetical protein
MEEIAFQFEKQIKDFKGIAGTADTVLTFQDDSRLKFTLSSNPNPQTVGGPTSMAHYFASSVKSFVTLTDGFEIIFRDGSKVAYNLKGMVKTNR